ncbi:MAG: 2-oxo acid dehydrogenase subunit E2, partial [Pseudomonadota bacterium]
RHAEAMDVWAMAREIARLSQAARDGTAKREELSGSSITITSLGAIGGVVTTPLINVPETAIIGVNKITERPVFDGAGRVVPRLFMNLSSSFDHRIVDGADAARLVQRIRTLLEMPARLFM